MLPPTHFLFAYLLIYAVSNNLAAAVACGLIAVLVDVDHIIKYYRLYRVFSIKETWRTAMSNRRSLRGVLHSKKTLLLSPLFLLGVAALNYALIAYYSHLLLDNLQTRLYGGDILSKKYCLPWLKISQNELLVLLLMLVYVLLAPF